MIDLGQYAMKRENGYCVKADKRRSIRMALLAEFGLSRLTQIFNLSDEDFLKFEEQLEQRYADAGVSIK